MDILVKGSRAADDWCVINEVCNPLCSEACIIDVCNPVCVSLCDDFCSPVVCSSDGPTCPEEGCNVCGILGCTPDVYCGRRMC